MPWQVSQVDIAEILITGPGRLELVLRDFQPQKVERPEDLGSEILGTLMQRTWQYEIEPGVWLQLISTSNTADLDRPEQHILHLGNGCSWHLPDAVAEAIHALGDGTTSG